MRIPIVIDLGSISRKEVRRLKRGAGKKMAEVAETAKEAKESAGPDAPPVVVLYRRKRRRRKRGRFPFPFPFGF